MALFAIWHDGASRIAADVLQSRLAAEAHIVPDLHWVRSLGTPVGRWHVAALATATAFYPPEAQLWEVPGEGLCLIHGLIWRAEGERAVLLDAAAIARLLDAPGCTLPADVAGEYAIARLHADGTLEAFGDSAGLHPIFHAADGSAALSTRAGFVATIAGDHSPDEEAGLWLGAIGYRVGTASGWRAARQLPQGARLEASGPLVRLIEPTLALPRIRGFDNGGADLIEAGLGQAKAALRLAAGDGPLDLPITGGKDSRTVLAIALAAGLKDRLTLFTRGFEGHPDVLAGATIAAATGVPHRREPPLGSDQATDLSATDFLRLLGTIAYQADGGMGGWDNVTGAAPGRESLVSGHMGELLKAYAKKLPHGGPLDPIELVRLQAPFDPIGLLRPQARARLADRLAGQMAEARAAGAEEDDLPDLFYARNRIPSWLGGIRQIKSFERQPVLPLGVPALMRLAFTMTAEERRAELAHLRLIEAAAPELLPLPFAHQRWSAALPGAPDVPPLVAAAGQPLFGTWQWSINRMPAVRARLTASFRAADVPLWADVDRAALLTALRERRFDYFDGISLFGLAVAVLHQAGWVVPRKLGGDPHADWAGHPPLGLDAPDDPVRLAGHLDLVDGAARRDGDALVVEGEGPIRFQGWLQAPDWPGAAVKLAACVDGEPLASASAHRPREDLVAAGIGDGRYGFALEVEAGRLVGGTHLSLEGPGGEGPDGSPLAILTS